ncbi:MAG: GNAT family N-acetyltransferase [Candidatus Aenigmarchaeota archaeon]
MKIRKATLKDVPMIMELWKGFMKDHDEIILKENPKFRADIEKRKSSPISFGRYIRKHLRSKNSIVFIAEVNGNPVGYNINAIKDNIPVFKVEKLGHFFEIFVRKEFRRMNISSKFKDLAFKWFRKNGIKHISMFVNKENKQAHSIYKKWGFYDFNIEMRRKI